MIGVIVPLLDLVALKGEENVLGILSRFSCHGKNDEVEAYLKETAIRHTRKNTSITHLVMTPDCSECLAYYTLAVKPFAISAERLNNRQKKEMRDIAFGTGLFIWAICTVGRNGYMGVYRDCGLFLCLCQKCFPSQSIVNLD